MDIKLRNSIIGGILITSLAIASYFLYFLPKQAHLENSIKCNKAGQEAYIAEASKRGIAYYNFKPIFLFSEKLNTCLFKGGFSYDGNIGAKVASYFIRDVYGNADLATYDIMDGRISGDFEAYNKLRNEYFGTSN